jgi:hypothetical protein
MKRILLFTLVICLFAGQASAALYYQMDATTAAAMRLLSTSTGDTATLDYVGYNPGGSGDWVFGATTEYGAGEGNMFYAVGFTGDLNDDDRNAYSDVGADSAIATLGITSPSLPAVNYDGFLLPVSNDNDDTWLYQAYVTTATNTYISGWSTGLAPDTQTTLLVNTPNMDYSTAVTGIGFQIRWDRSLNNERTGDDYNTSVVPVPGAILLGILGLSVASIKLRKYA